MSHTPGPWGYQNDTITSKYGDIARLHYQSGRGRAGLDDRPLIAAAPELLAALKWVDDWLMANVEASEEVNDIVAKAIAKAEGRSE
jgi:hypothetical protein